LCPFFDKSQRFAIQPWIWDALLPGLFDEDDTVLFVGIGSLLNDTLPSARRTLVFGAGVGYGKGLPRVDHTWTIYCLRGPLSAQALGVPTASAVTDAAVLVRRLAGADRGRTLHRVSFMPHHLHASPMWLRVCEDLKVGYVDPQRPVAEVLAAIGSTDVLLTEALRGAVAADALRVAWIPVHTRPTIMQFKWQDWCASVGLAYSPRYTWPLWKLPDEASVTTRLRHRLKHSLVARQLVRIANTTRPMLSSRRRLEELTLELERRLQRVRADMAAGCFALGSEEECEPRCQ
jgi:succinoglycan biosynthesis protein ExoV